MKDKDKSTCKMYIDGRWCDAASGDTFDAINPALGSAFGVIPKGGRDDAQRAVAAANKAFLTWRNVSLWERSAMCMRVADILDNRKDELADILCTELGKPRHQEAQMEASEASTPWRIAGEQAKYLEANTVPCEDPHKRVLTFRQPLGVVSVMTPWNFPVAIAGEYLPYAIVMGNTVCWTPAPTASASAVKLMECIHEAQVPAGVINLVTGMGAVVGDELVVNPGTHAVAMTGSPQTAHIISGHAGLKPRLFELGGNGPVIILPDADPEKIAPSIAGACFFAAGQVCSCSGRIFVAENLRKRFIDAMAEESKKWVPADPWDKDTTMGPLNSAGVLDKVADHISDAVTKGAQVITGGKRPDRSGFFWEPTVIAEFSDDSLINMEETFGPVAPIKSFRSDNEVWHHINACNLGLVSSVFTQDVQAAWRWAQQLNTGITVVNDWTHFWEHHLPFGGMSRNESGMGRIGGRHTLEFMSNLKTIAFNLGDPTTF
jgi:acyl-CoA reductase-like NAD-dependent aldehyde dehydrogenase